MLKKTTSNDLDSDSRKKTAIYTDGSYLEMSGGTWHLEDSPMKARWIREMLARHSDIRLHTVCEIGCGAGGVIAELLAILPEDVTFTGYEISPQAHKLSALCANRRYRYVLGDAFADSVSYDLVLVLDVVEHVEDCFSFMRQTKHKGRLKLYHIPLDAHVSSILRGTNAWDSVGHLHLFTIETALKSLEHCGHRIIDWMLTDGAIQKPQKLLRTRVANLLRFLLRKPNLRLAARLLGGYSILILAE